MVRLKILLPVLTLILLVGFVFAADGIYKSSTPSIFGNYESSVKQPVKYGQYMYSHYDPRVINYYRLNVHAYLKPIEGGDLTDFERGMNPIFPEGTAHILSAKSKVMPKSQVYISVKDLPMSARSGMACEAWLFDEESGYALSLGTFRTVGFGTGVLEWHTDQYIDEYDYVFITEEPYPDYDPRPEEVVLQARIPKPNYFYEREFGTTDKMYGYTLT
ncbi:hypothetical protein KY304_01085 [Candidatus Woesearchaeota archaeon]|nr:hypothetical protein [Candidatus Woesearchaeota archaeon]